MPTDKSGSHLFKSGAEWRGNAAGRPKGSRNKLAEDFIGALYDDFTKAVEGGGSAQGALAIAKVRESDPSTYVRVIAGLLPKDVTLKVDPLDELDDRELGTVVAAARAALRLHQEGRGYVGEADGGEQAH